MNDDDKFSEPKEATLSFSQDEDEDDATTPSDNESDQDTLFRLLQTVAWDEHQAELLPMVEIVSSAFSRPPTTQEMQFVLMRWAALSISNPQGTPQTQAQIIEDPQTGWIIADYGDKLETSPGKTGRLTNPKDKTKPNVERSFLTSPARTIASKLISMAKERHWPGVKIDDILPPNASEFHDKIKFFAWEAAIHSQLKTDHIPSPTERRTLKILEKMKTLDPGSTKPT